MKKKGFTLIELVVVMAIIAVLSLLIIAAITAARRASQNTARTGDIKTVETALETYSSKHGGRYPNSTESANNINTLIGLLKTDGYLNQYPASMRDDDGLPRTDNTTIYAYVANSTGTKYTLSVCSIESDTSISATLGGVAPGEIPTDTQAGCEVIYTATR